MKRGYHPHAATSRWCLAVVGLHQGGFKNPQICSRRRQSAHFPSITEISADSRRRLRFLESALPPPSPLQFLFSLLCYLRFLLLVHGFGIEQEISADSCRRLRFLESALGCTVWFGSLISVGSPGPWRARKGQISPLHSTLPGLRPCQPPGGHTRLQSLGPARLIADAVFAAKCAGVRERGGGDELAQIGAGFEFVGEPEIPLETGVPLPLLLLMHIRISRPPNSLPGLPCRCSHRVG